MLSGIDELPIHHSLIDHLLEDYKPRCSIPSIFHEALNRIVNSYHVNKAMGISHPHITEKVDLIKYNQI